MQLQGFDQLVVPDADEAVTEGLLERLRVEWEVEVVVAEGEVVSNVSGHPEYAFVPMLRSLLLPVDQEEEAGGSDASTPT
jgi:hypothetical protein